MRSTRNTRHVAAAASALLVIGGLTACGDDGSDASNEACEAFAGIDKAFTQDQPDPEAIGRHLDTLEDNRPEEVSDELQVMVDAGRQVVATQDFAAFDSDEFVAAEATVDPFMFENCDAGQKVEIAGVDYEFSGVPESLEAGDVAFLFDNKSEGELHEMVLLRRKDGVDESFEEILALPEELLPEKVDLIGAASAPPGDQGATWVDLTAGDYAMVCYIPQGAAHAGDATDGPLHFTLGMTAELTVE